MSFDEWFESKYGELYKGTALSEAFRELTKAAFDFGRNNNDNRDRITIESAIDMIDWGCSLQELRDHLSN